MSPVDSTVSRGQGTTSEKFDSPPYSEYSTASKMAASLGPHNLQSKEQLWLAELAALLEEPFTSYLKCDASKADPEHNRHKNRHGVASKVYPECGPVISYIMYTCVTGTCPSLSLPSWIKVGYVSNIITVPLPCLITFSLMVTNLISEL